MIINMFPNLKKIDTVGVNSSDRNESIKLVKNRRFKYPVVINPI